jgi:hypothetical protein
VNGLRALSEAITGIKCHVYEIWRLIDGQGPQGGGVSLLSWYQIMATYPTWASIQGTSWNSLQGFTSQVSSTFGGLGINCRNEVIIQPRRNYGTSVKALQAEGSDVFGITAVCEVLKPANVLLSVNPLAQQVYTPTPIAALYADSEYWEITYTVLPAILTDPAYTLAQASYQKDGVPVTAPWSVPSPPDCRSQGTQISYAADVTVAWAQGFQNGQPVDVTDYEVEAFAGQQVTYTAQLALMDPVRAASARTSSSVGIQAAPYAGPRVPVVPSG